MSIRLRLTLLYTTILALTLASLGGILYSTQYRSMSGSEERSLADLARRVVEHRQLGREFGEPAFPPLPPQDEAGDPGRPPVPNRRFGFPATYVQVINLEGQVLSRSENLQEVTLPLSHAGLQAVQRGESWVEMASIEDERLMIYSAPVAIEGRVTEIVQVAHSIAGQDQYLGTLGRNLLVGSGIAVMIAFGSGWILSGVVLRPIHRVTQTARAIGTERDLSRRVQYAGPNDEIGQLATTFNAMLTELQAAYQQVEQSLQQQRKFVADVSHELRTPLTTLRGNLALLRRKPSISDEDRADILNDMADESDRLIRLVNDLLALAHAESGRLLRSDVVPIRPLVEDVCRQGRLLDPERLVTCTSVSEAAVIGDQDALRQVLLILVDNALKHTAGPVTVTAEAAGEHVTMSVRDAGPGLEPEVLAHIFERFYRGKSGLAEREIPHSVRNDNGGIPHSVRNDNGEIPHSVRNDDRERPGIGLGLAIAKALVEAQGGTIAVESQAEQGSVFTVSLPRAVHP